MPRSARKRGTRSSTNSRSPSGCALSCASNFSPARRSITPASPRPGRAGRRSHSLIEILAIVSRGDVRGEVLKDLERQANLLTGFGNRPGVDRTRLDALLARRSPSCASNSAVAAPTTPSRSRTSEFLAAIRHRSAIPGGTCEFDLPDFKHWLSLPEEQPLQRFPGLVPAPETIMRCHRAAVVADTRVLARPSRARTRRHVPVPDRPLHRCQLVRISLPAGAEYYPEISGGQHRFTVRFLSWSGPEQRPVQVSDEVRFELTCC